MAVSHRGFDRVFLVFWRVKQLHKFLEALTGCFGKKALLRTVY